MKNFAVLVALAGLAVAANAGPGKIDILVRNVTVGGPAADRVDASAGDTVEVQCWYYWGDPTGFTALGLSAVTHNITSSDFDASNSMFDTGDKRVPPFNYGQQTQRAFRLGNTLRIADAANTGDLASGGISVSQGSPFVSGGMYNASNPALGFAFTFVVGTGQTSDINFDAPANRIYRYRVHTSATNVTGTPKDISFDATDGATVVLLCPADFDKSGFVDTDDFTAYVLAFEAGTDNADFDGSGFVDTDDFTAFTLAFEAGC